MENEHLWSLILAGGEGERTRPFIKRWLGVHRPKQYCKFVGTRSLFQHTLDRADKLSPAERRVAVIARNHLAEAQAQVETRGGRLVLQPENRGTAAGVFLPLTYIYASDPKATVVIYPSDHFVFPEDGLISAVGNAVLAVERIPGQLILLGAPPRDSEHDYGWILPGQEYRLPLNGPLHTVRNFLEKPDPLKTREVLAAGGLWNTLIVVTQASSLWKLGWYLLPQMMVQFERIRKAIGSSRETEVIEEAYKMTPDLNFSTDILQNAPWALAVKELAGVYWNDWGRPDRIVETLHAIGKKPLFPAEALAAS